MRWPDIEQVAASWLVLLACTCGFDYDGAFGPGGAGGAGGRGGQGGATTGGTAGQMSSSAITSAGRLGGIFVTPLINHPEVAILGLHRVAPRPVVRDGEVVVRPMGNVSVTFDHRVVDGLQAAAFCLDVIDRLQQPA